MKKKNERGFFGFKGGREEEDDDGVSGAKDMK